MTERSRGAGAAGDAGRSPGRLRNGWLGRLAPHRNRPEEPAGDVMTVADLVSARGLGPARSADPAEPGPAMERAEAAAGAAQVLPVGDGAGPARSADPADARSDPGEPGPAVECAEAVGAARVLPVGDGAGPARGLRLAPEGPAAVENVPAAGTSRRNRHLSVVADPEPPADDRGSTGPRAARAKASGRSTAGGPEAVQPAKADPESADPESAVADGAEREGAESAEPPLSGSTDVDGSAGAARPEAHAGSRAAGAHVAGPDTVEPIRPAADEPSAKAPGVADPGARVRRSKAPDRPATTSPELAVADLPPNPTDPPAAELVVPPWSRVPPVPVPEPGPAPEPEPEDTAARTDRLTFRRLPVRLQVPSPSPRPRPRPAPPAPGPATPVRPPNRFSVAPRPTVVDDLTITGITRRSRGRWGSRLFTLFFVFVFAVILLQLVDSLLHPLYR